MDLDVGIFIRGQGQVVRSWRERKVMQRTELALGHLCTSLSFSTTVEERSDRSQAKAMAHKDRTAAQRESAEHEVCI